MTLLLFCIATLSIMGWMVYLEPGLPLFKGIGWLLTQMINPIILIIKQQVPSIYPANKIVEWIGDKSWALVMHAFVFVFVVPFALAFKWSIGWLSNMSVLSQPTDFAGYAIALLVCTVICGALTLSLTNIVVQYFATSFITGYAMLLNQHSTEMQVPVIIAAVGSVIMLSIHMENDNTKPRQQLATPTGGTNGATNQKTTSIVNFAKKAKFNFSSVAGMSELKVELLKAGNAVILSKGKHEAKNGILFHGDPGNGKTFIAEALAGELGLRFLPVTFGDMASKWVGETTSNAMKVFDDAEAQAPCLLFMDEIDSVFIDRSKVVNADSEAPKTLNAILTRLVDIRSKGVLVVAATNFLDKLDPASIREGRFDFKIEIPCPDYEARQSLILNTLRSGLTIDREVLESVSRRWEGFSVSRIRAIGDKTREMLTEKGIKQVTFDHLMEALRKIQGSKGDRIAEDVLPIEKLSLNPEMRIRFNRIAARMKNIDEVESFGGTAPTGVLFSGPPGTGKTLGVMSLAKSTGWAFIKTTGNELLESPDKMDKIKARALDIRPCIIFIDEADDVLADRSMSAAKSVTNRLLAIMDGAGGKLKDVVFIAATNHPELLDEAMLRGGRFTEKIEFSLPTDDVISGYVAEWISKTKAPLADDFNVQNVTELLSGQSLANAKEILQGAINESIERISGNRNEKVRLADLISAINLIASD